MQEVTILVDGAEVTLPTGSITAFALGKLAGYPPEIKISLLCDGDVDRALADGETLQLTEGARIVSAERRVYRPSPRHKRVPSRGDKGTICPRDVDAQALLDTSCSVAGKKARWAVDENGCAFCARSDNAGGWHGYPVRLSDVPNAIVSYWARSGRIDARMLRDDKLCTG